MFITYHIHCDKIECIFLSNQTYKITGIPFRVRDKSKEYYEDVTPDFLTNHQNYFLNKKSE